MFACTTLAREWHLVRAGHAQQLRHAQREFNFHIEQLGEFDRPFACFINDLFERGLLEQTLVVVLSEFGRTPNINLY